MSEVVIILANEAQFNQIYDVTDIFLISIVPLMRTIYLFLQFSEAAACELINMHNILTCCKVLEPQFVFVGGIPTRVTISYFYVRSLVY